MLCSAQNLARQAAAPFWRARALSVLDMLTLFSRRGNSLPAFPINEFNGLCYDGCIRLSIG
jgi:hypothetical protein